MARNPKTDAASDEGSFLSRTTEQPSVVSPALPPMGVNLIGHITGNLGLGVAARNTLRALTESGRPVEVIDIDPGAGRGGHDQEYAHLVASQPTAPWRVNLFHLNPTEVGALVRARPTWLDVTGRVNACVPFWELPRLPVTGGWVEMMEALDVVLAPTRFVADAVRASAPRATVWHFPQAVYLPDGVAADRERFGLPKHATLFYMSLDITSDTRRKNPEGALDAFARAFDGRDDARLVVKLNNRGTTGWGDAAARAIEDRIRHDERIIVIDEALPYTDVLALSASCDVYVSLHRSEGLGLNLLEAMSLGKPVISTAWSGTMDFTGEEDSCLVGYDLVPVVASHPAYRPDAIGPGQVWAEPRVDEAAHWMRRLADDAELRARIGSRALAAMAARREQHSKAPFYDRLAAEFADRPAPAETAARRQRWGRVAHVPLARRARSAAGRLARALGLRR
jgi:glycosyltransferase involved in cell wall biosynthesis